MSLSNLQLNPQFVQAVRDAIDIVDVAQGYTKLVRAGRKWKGLCPLHKEKTPSFNVDADLGFFKCFGCGAGGDAIKLHMLLTGDDFAAAMESLAQRYGVPLPALAAHRGSRARAAAERDPEAVLEAAAEWFRDQLGRSDFARGYLARRQIPRELVERYDLGFAPEGWRNLLGALGGRFSPGDLLEVGLAARPDGGGEPYDRFRNRLIFPIRNAAGRLVGFGGRTLGDDVAKYVNTAETERFRKSSLLYGLDQAKRPLRDARRALLVEGYLDVLAAVAAGIETAVASMGTALTQDQARLLARFADEVIVGYDADEAGETAARRALPILAGQGLSTRRMRLPAGEDPDSLRVKAGEAAVRAAFDQADDLVLSELERLAPSDLHRNPAARSKAAKQVTELLQAIPDTIVRYGYARAAADRLGVPAQLVWQRVGVGREAVREAMAPPAAAVSEPPTPGRRAEEEVVRALLLAVDRGVEVPPLDGLPPAAAFLDPALRKFFEAFRSLYQSGQAPRLAEVLSAVGPDEGADERAAHLLLESEDSAAAPISEALRNLRRRWLKGRLRELSRGISEAERRGDRGRVAELVAEKHDINQELHGLSARGADLE
jgi:DNA primase